VIQVLQEIWAKLVRKEPQEILDPQVLRVKLDQWGKQDLQAIQEIQDQLVRKV
jgi:hypothetical protein